MHKRTTSGQYISQSLCTHANYIEVINEKFLQLLLDYRAPVIDINTDEERDAWLFLELKSRVVRWIRTPGHPARLNSWSVICPAKLLPRPFKISQTHLLIDTAGFIATGKRPTQ